MKGYLLLPIFCVCVLFISWQSLSDTSLREVYAKVDVMSKKNTPLSYNVRVENDKFQEALSELPEEILTGDGKPYVMIDFRKGEGVRIIIKNVDSEYATIFSYIEDYVKFSGISKVQNPVEFKEIIDKGKVEVHKEDKEFIVVQAWEPEKEVKDDNYALFYLDKKNWVIKKAIYYLDGAPFMEAVNSYKKFGEYYLPYKTVLTSLNENTQDIFYFKDYKFYD